MNCLCDCFLFCCHLGSHIVSLRFDKNMKMQSLVSVRPLKLCKIITSPEIKPFIPVLVTLALFQGHKGMNKLIPKLLFLTVILRELAPSWTRWILALFHCCVRAFKLYTTITSTDLVLSHYWPWLCSKVRMVKERWNWNLRVLWYFVFWFLPQMKKKKASLCNDQG